MADFLVMGVFEQEAEARRALDELRSVGFERDDLGLALREGGAPVAQLVADLVQLGLSNEQAEFYFQEVQSGKAVVSVRTDQAREQQVQDLLKRYAAYSFESRSDTKEPSQNNSPSPNELISSPQSVPQPLSFSSAHDHFADPLEGIGDGDQEG